MSNDATGSRNTPSEHAGRLAADALKNHGVDVLFTLSGGHLFPLYDGCVQTDIRIVDTRHEQTAAFAAEAWAKTTRRPGVAALTAGPGVTNGISAITGASMTGSPMLVIGGRAPQARWGFGSLQELDHVPIVESVTKHAATAGGPATVGEDVDRALRAAATAHRGPAFLDVPMDYFFAPAGGAFVPTVRPEELRTPSPDPEQVAAVAERLQAAERPVLFAGADLYWEGAEGALRRLCEQLSLPVFMNGLGRGTLPADHAMAFSRARSTALRQADLVIVVGVPLDFRLRYGQFGGAAVAHLMDSPERIAQHTPLAASCSGNLEEALDGLREGVAARGGASFTPWAEQLRAEEQAKRAQEEAILADASSPIHPARIYGELRRRLDRDAIVIGDGGDYVSYAGKYVDTFEPGCFLDPGPYGCLGTGPGYVLGAALAHPGRQIVLVLGDGAAGFSLGDWDTLVRFGIRATIVVGNNRCWGLEKHPMKSLYGYHVAAELGDNARYDLVAENLGAGGELVERPEQLGAALERGFDADGLYVVNVLTDPENVYPRSANLG